MSQVISSIPDHEYDLDGITVGYEVEYDSYGPGDTVNRTDVLVHITHIDGEPVDGPFTLIEEWVPGECELYACRSSILAALIAEVAA